MSQIPQSAAIFHKSQPRAQPRRRRHQRTYFNIYGTVMGQQPSLAALGLGRKVILRDERKEGRHRTHYNLPSVLISRNDARTKLSAALKLSGEGYVDCRVFYAQKVRILHHLLAALLLVCQEVLPLLDGIGLALEFEPSSDFQFSSFAPELSPRPT